MKFTAAENSQPPFYVVAHERGAENPRLPTWAMDEINPFNLEVDRKSKVERKTTPGVPGAFQLLNVLSKDECQRFVDITESLGYLPDAPVSLPRNVRHNDNVTMVVDETTDSIIWQRVAPFFALGDDYFSGKKPIGLNARFRLYRYGEGDFFKPHTDGAWPGSRVINHKLITQAYDDRWSQMTFLIFLTEDFEGGETQFFIRKSSAQPDHAFNKVKLRTPQGGVLVFPHGVHPMHSLHSSEPILSGTKYIIRTDVLFEL